MRPRNSKRKKNRKASPSNQSLMPDDNLSAMDVMGRMPLNTTQARADYIASNAIQSGPPTTEGVGMDAACSSQQYAPSYDYVNQHVLAYFIASSSFIGYHAMSLLAQNWLIAKGCSQKARDAMKKGFELTRNDGEALTSAEKRKIKKLDKKYKLSHNIVEGESFNNIFGVRHILFKNTDPNFDYEKPFNPDSFKSGKYAGMAQIDPYWVTPELNNDDITDPTAINYYEPTFWLIGSQRYHKSHFVILTGEPVADYLKPTYRYGGISMTQKVYERVYAGERTANEIPQLALTKRMNVLKVDLAKVQANKTGFVKNLNVMNEYRDNYGIKVIGKDEEVTQLETTLTDLDKVMWAEYHLVASIFDMPVSKLYGTGHGGLGTGDTDDDYYISSLEALQSGNLEGIAEAHYERLMMSEFGKPMDLDIAWSPLKVMSELDRAAVNSQNASAAHALWQVGAISDVDERERLISDKNSGYSGMEKLEVEDE